MGMEENTIIEYKLHRDSLRDKSTFKNTESFVFQVGPVNPLALPFRPLRSCRPHVQRRRHVRVRVLLFLCAHAR